MKATPTVVTHVFYTNVVCSSITPVHPAKPLGRNEMPFGRDTRVVPSNTALDWGPLLPGRGELGVGTQNPRSQRVPPFAKLLWPLLLLLLLLLLSLLLLLYYYYYYYYYYFALL